MSRSRKKEPVQKDPNNSQGKKTANRLLRRKTKQAIHTEQEELPLLDEVLNVHNFVDYKIRGYKKDSETKKRMKRK